MTAGTKAHKAAREAALAATVDQVDTVAPAAVPAGDLVDTVAPAAVPAGMPAVTLEGSTSDLVDAYACWSTADLARDVPTLLTDARAAAAAGNADLFAATWRALAGRAVALSRRPDMPAGYPIGRYLVAVPAGDLVDRVSREVYGAPGHVHVFTDSGDAYDACQTSDMIQTGDALIIAGEGIAGVADTYPVAATAVAGELHTVGDVDRDSLVTRDGVDLVTAGTRALSAFAAVTGTAPAPAAYLVAFDAVPAVEAPAPVVPTRTLIDTVTAGSVPAGEAGTMLATVDRKAFIAALTYVAQRTTAVYRRVILSVVAGTLHVTHHDGEIMRTVALPAGDNATDGTVSAVLRAADVRKVAGRKVGRARLFDLTADAAGALRVTGYDGASVEFAPAPAIESAPAAPATDHVIGEIAARDLVDMVDRVAPAVGTDDELPMLQTVRVRTDGARFDVAGTDRYRLHVAAGRWSPTPDGDTLVAPASEYLVSARHLVDFVRAIGDQVDTVTVSVGSTLAGGMVAPTYGLTAGTLSTVITCYADKPYPPVDKLFPARSNGTVTLPAGDLVTLVDGVVSDAAAVPGADTRACPVILFFDGSDQVTAQYGVAPEGSGPAATRSMPAGEIAGTLPDYVAFNPAYLVATVAGAAHRAGAGELTGSVTLDMIDMIKPVVIRADGDSNGATTLIMPIRATVSPLGSKVATVDQVKREAPAPAADNTVVLGSNRAPHAFAPAASNRNRCGVDGCGAGRMAMHHRAARAAETADAPAGDQVDTVAAVPAVAAPATGDQVDGTAGTETAGTVELTGPIVASVDAVDLVAGVTVVANGGTVGRIVRRITRHRTDGFDLMTGGQYTTHYALRMVLPAVIGATVCATPAGSCRRNGCAGMVHVAARDLVKLPRLTPAGDQVDTPAAVPAVRRPLIDGRDALAGMVRPIAPECRAVAILPAGALAAVTNDPRPADFNPYRAEIRDCQCPTCNELSYNAHHWSDKRDHLQAARVLLAHLVAGTHVHMTIKEVASEARAHRDNLVAIAESAGVTGEALERVRDPHAFMVRAARAAKRDEFENGLGIGMTPGGIMGTRRHTEYVKARAAAAGRTLGGYDMPAGDQVAHSPADVVDQVDTGTVIRPAAPAPADQVDTVADTETAGSVEMTADTYAETAGDLVDTPAGDLVDGVPVDALHGACPAAVHVYDRGDVAGYRFDLVAGTRAKALAHDVIRPALKAAGYDRLITITAPRKAGMIGVVPKEGADVADWSPVLAIVAGAIGAALAG